MKRCGCLTMIEQFGCSECSGCRDKSNYMGRHWLEEACVLTIPTEQDTGIPDIAANLDDSRPRKHSDSDGSVSSKYRESPVDV